MDLLVATEECDEVLRGNYGDGDPPNSDANHQSDLVRC